MQLANSKAGTTFKSSPKARPAQRKAIRTVHILRPKPRGLQALVVAMARALVDVPSAVKVAEAEGDRCALLTLSVAREDVGKIIGRRGHTVQAVRVLLNAAAAREKKHVVLEILE
jgi:predicted RNA-binding protein YlqC (UPF0109 family)